MCGAAEPSEEWPARLHVERERVLCVSYEFAVNVFVTVNWQTECDSEFDQLSLRVNSPVLSQVAAGLGWPLEKGRI